MVGQGGMATVYRAIHRQQDTVVALKIMSREVTYEDKQIKRFNQEAQSCSKLQHPNIVRVFDYGQSSDGLFYIAMELLEGPSLSELIKEEFPVSGQRACLLMRQVCEALQEAHGKGIVHRDLKPDNIMLSGSTGNGEVVKILDFGIAKVVNENTHETLTQTGYICGTPLYISPEQSLGKQLDGRADLYSVGVILFELLTGRQPFVADTAIALVMKHIHDTPPRVRAVYPEVEISDELEEYIYQLLQKDRTKRPNNAEDVVADLLRLSTIPPREAGSYDDDLVPTAEEVDGDYNSVATMAIVAPTGADTVFAKRVNDESDDADKTQVQIGVSELDSTTDVNQNFNADATLAIPSENLQSTVAFSAEELDSTMAIQAPVVNTDKVSRAAIRQRPSSWLYLWAIVILTVVGMGGYLLTEGQNGDAKTDQETIVSTSNSTMTENNGNRASKLSKTVSTVVAPAALVQARNLDAVPIARGRRSLEPVSISGGPSGLTPPAEFGILIETVPSKANVVIRNEQVGRTPYTFRVGPNTPETSVIVTRRGYFPQTWSFKPSAAWPPGQTKVKLVLKREPRKGGGGGNKIKWE